MAVERDGNRAYLGFQRFHSFHTTVSLTACRRDDQEKLLRTANDRAQLLQQIAGYE